MKNKLVLSLVLVPVLVLVLAGDGRADDTVTFDQAVQEAIKKNPQAAKAVEQINRAEALLRQARASSLPTINATGTYTRLDNDRGSFCTLQPCPPNPTRPFLPANSLQANVNITVPIISGANWVRWMHAGDQIDVAKATAVDVARQIALTAARSYLTVVAAHRVVNSFSHARDTAKAHLDFATARLGAGIGNRIDQVRASQQFSQAELQFQNASLNLVRAKEALGVILGREGPVDVGPEPTLGNVDANAALSGANARADVVAAAERWHAARNVQRDGWTDFLPTVNGSFVPFYQEPPSIAIPQTGWQALIVLSLPLYDGGLRYGVQRERASNTEQARLDHEAALRQAKADVRVALEAVRIADDALKAARDNQSLADQAVDLANTAYRAGATTNIEVVDAERVAREAATQVAVAEDASRQARLDLLAASGRFP
jgi:outer membrane protein TolC